MLALTLSSSLSSSSFAAEQKQTSKQISSVTFYDTEQNNKIDQQLFESILGFSYGKKYSETDLSDRISKLEELVNYKVSEWKIDRNDQLIVSMAKKKKIASVEFVNNKSISSRKLSEEIGFRTEGAYCEDLCSVIETKVRKYYADQGFYNAEVELKKEVLENGSLKILVKITEKEPATISSVTIEAEGIINAEQLEKILNIKQGARVRYSYIQDRIKNLKQYLYDKSCYAASIYKNSIKIAPDAKSASIEVGVRTGPRFDLVFRGNNFFFNPQVLRTTLDITATDIVNKEYYSVLVNKLENFYYSMGFVEPKIDLVEVLGDKKWELKLVFNIKEGPRKFFRNVDYKVQRGFASAFKLDDYVRNKKATLFERNFFVKKDFEEIRAVIEDFFAEQGYLRARVASMSVQDVSKTTVDVSYDVDAGSETIIRDISFSGNTAFSTKELTSKLGLVEGNGLKVQLLSADINKLIDSYRDLGYADAYIDKENVLSYSDDRRVVDVNINIYEGDKYKIGKIFIDGLVKTKDRVVTREFEFSEGDKIALVDLQETENKLASLGLFGSASVMLLPSSVKGPGYKDVLVKVEEKKSGTYEIGFGYRTDEGIKVSSGVVYGNLGGWNRRINLDGSIARRLDDQFRFIQYSINSGYYEPYFYNLPLDFRVTVGYAKEDLTEYARKAFDASFYFQKTIGIHYFELRNSFERINIFDATLPADDTAYWKYSIRQTYKLDTRDSVFSPNRGFLFSVYGEWGRSFKSQSIANYLKVVEQARLYIPVFTSWTIVPAFNAGYIKGLRGESILLDERFALGGMDSIRGYREGIINDLTPQIGSQYFYTSTLEIRKLLFWKFVGVAFTDVGNISSQDPSLNGPFSSVGGGLSIKLPVGSLSLQYGYIFKLDKRVPPDRMGRTHFSLGTF